MESQALAFFLVNLVWDDVMLSSMRKKIPSAASVYRKLLAEKTFDKAFRDITGCEGWVMLAIIDTTNLEIWRHDQEKNGTLSIRSLVGRAREIELRVEREMRRFSSLFDPGPAVYIPTTAPDLGTSTGSAGSSLPIVSSQTSIPRDGSQPHDIQTYIFSHAILTELHKVVAGPRGTVPEISQSIKNALALAWNLRVPTLIPLRSLVWPFCVSASLATGSQREAFRSMVSPTEAPVEDTMHRLRYVVETCWGNLENPARDGLAVYSDWKDILERSKSLDILLL